MSEGQLSNPVILTDITVSTGGTTQFEPYRPRFVKEVSHSQWVNVWPSNDGITIESDDGNIVFFYTRDDIDELIDVLKEAREYV